MISIVHLNRFITFQLNRWNHLKYKTGVWGLVHMALPFYVVVENTCGICTGNSDEMRKPGKALSSSGSPCWATWMVRFTKSFCIWFYILLESSYQFLIVCVVHANSIFGQRGFNIIQCDHLQPCKKFLLITCDPNHGFCLFLEKINRHHGANF